MVHFSALDISDEESIKALLQSIDMAIQVAGRPPPLLLLWGGWAWLPAAVLGRFMCPLPPADAHTCPPSCGRSTGRTRMSRCGNGMHQIEKGAAAAMTSTFDSPLDSISLWHGAWGCWSSWCSSGQKLSCARQHNFALPHSSGLDVLLPFFSTKAHLSIASVAGVALQFITKPVQPGSAGPATTNLALMEWRQWQPCMPAGWRSRPPPPQPECLQPC